MKWPVRDSLVHEAVENLREASIVHGSQQRKNAGPLEKIGPTNADMDGKAPRQLRQTAPQRDMSYKAGRAVEGIDAGDGRCVGGSAVSDGEFSTGRGCT